MMMFRLALSALSNISHLHSIALCVFMFIRCVLGCVILGVSVSVFVCYAVFSCVFMNFPVFVSVSVYISLSVRMLGSLWLIVCVSMNLSVCPSVFVWLFGCLCVCEYVRHSSFSLNPRGQDGVFIFWFRGEMRLDGINSDRFVCLAVCVCQCVCFVCSLCQSGRGKRFLQWEFWVGFLWIFIEFFLKTGTFFFIIYPFSPCVQASVCSIHIPVSPSLCMHVCVCLSLSLSLCVCHCSCVHDRILSRR